MTTRHQVSLVTGVLILAIILPVALSIWLAMQQAKAQFYTGLDNFSVRVLAPPPPGARHAAKLGSGLAFSR